MHRRQPVCGHVASGDSGDSRRLRGHISEYISEHQARYRVRYEYNDGNLIFVVKARHAAAQDF